MKCAKCKAEVGETHGGLCSTCFMLGDMPMKPAPPGPHTFSVKTALPTIERRSVLDEAAAIVDGARQEAYGKPSDNHGRTAAMWSAYLGIELDAEDVCMLNVLQKVSRQTHARRRDNLVDIAGYVRNAELCQRPGCGGE